MVHFKGCPRCKGDINVRKDWFGEYMTCLQCGWSKDMETDPLSRLARAVRSAESEDTYRKAS